MWEILVVEFIVCIIFALLLYKKYGSYTKRPYYVTLLTLGGWILCFFIVFLVPNDVSQAAQCDLPLCTDYSNSTAVPLCDQPGVKIIVDPNVLTWIWRVVYWITLLATWGIYPIMQSYSMTGEFSFGEKMRTSIKSNLLLYAIMGTVLGIIGVIYILESGIKWSSVPATAMAAANAYGLFMIIAMLGHGLVNVPRGFWNQANLVLTLKKYQFEVADYDSKLHEAKSQLTKTLKKVRKASEITSENDAFRKYIDIIISKCPKEFETILFGEGNIEISYKSLASLHEKLMKEDHAVQLYTSLLKNTLDKAFFLQDIVNSKGNYDHKIKWTFRAARSGTIGNIIDKLEYFWYCYIKTRVLQLICIFCVLVSIIIVWSELVFFVCRIDLSVVSLYIRAIDGWPPFILQGLILLPVIYIALCTYSSLFRLRLFNYYHIVPHSKSDSNSLLFSAAYLCRLTSPLAYNFMEMAHYKNTAFVAVIGELDISNLGEFFQEFFPILLLPFILMTLFNIYSKILSLLRIKRFQFDDDFNDQQIDDGKDIMEDEREKRKNRSPDRDNDEKGSKQSGGGSLGEKTSVSSSSSLSSSRSSSSSRSRDNLNNIISIEELPEEIILPPPTMLQRFKNFFSSPSVNHQSSSSSSSSMRKSSNSNVTSYPSFKRNNDNSGSSSSGGGNKLPSFLDDDSSDDPWSENDNPFKL